MSVSVVSSELNEQQGQWMESASEWNHQEVAGSTPTTGWITKRILTITQHLFSVMVNRIRPVCSRVSNKGFSLRFGVDFRVQLKTPEESRRTYRPKREYNNKYEINRPNIQSNNNYQASSKKFRHVFINRILNCLHWSYDNRSLCKPPFWYKCHQTRYNNNV